MKEILMALTNQEQYPLFENVLPDITHARIVNFSVELPRDFNNKVGSIKLWVAKGWKDPVANLFCEAPGLEGLQVEIEPFISFILEGTEGALFQVCKKLTEYLISNGDIIGTLEINEV